MQIYLTGLDELDNKIVNLLYEDGRMSYSKIADIVGLSRPAVKARVAALEEKGVILGYRAEIDYNHISVGEQILLYVETTPSFFAECKQMLTSLPNVLTLFQITGENRLVAITEWESRKSLKEFINYIYKSLDGVTSIRIDGILDVIKGAPL